MTHPPEALVRGGPSPVAVQAIRAGDWTGLAAALAADPLADPGDAALLGCLARGALDGDPPRLPSYRLVRAVGPAIAAALRLGALARGLDPAGATATLRAALAFAPDDPTILLWLAWRRHDDGALADALVLAERALAADPISVDALTALGWFLARADRYDAAEHRLEQAIALAPAHAPAHLRLGLSLQRAGRLAAAESALRTALAHDPHADDVNQALAWLLDELGRTEEALRHSEPVLLRNPSPGALLLQAWLLERTGKPEPAIALLERALADAPHQRAVRCRLAALLARTGRPAEAARVLDDGLARAPDDSQLEVAAAWLQHRLGWSAHAAAIAARVLARDPEDAGAWEVTAALREAEGRVAEAEACVMRALAAQPQAAELVLWRARLIRRQQRPADAAWLVQQLCDRQPHRVDARLLLAWLKLDLKDFAGARRLLHGALRDRAAAADAWRGLAVALAGMERWTTARHAARRACRLAPRAPEALQLRAWLEHTVGDLADARAAAAELIALAPDDVDALVLAARIATDADALDDAERHATRAVALASDSPDAWLALGRLHQRRRQPEAAEACLHAAWRLAPQRAELPRALGRILIDDDRLAEAEIATLRALELAPDDPVARLELAECRLLAGHFDAALAAAEQALALRPAWPPARLARARSRIGLGRGAPADRRAALWDAAAGELAALVRAAPHDPEHGRALLALAADGAPAARVALALMPRAVRRTLHREGLELTVAHGNAAALATRAALAAADFPEDSWLACAGLYASAMTGAGDAATQARATRAWVRDCRLRVGTVPPPRLPAPTAGARLRVAYLAAILHERLLLPVLAAHDPAAVEPFLYTSRPEIAAPTLAPGVSVIRLDGDTLIDSLRAHRIDVVVDTVGVHPFHGQIDVLRALAARVAPIQCAWLGSWGPAGDLYDVLIADASAVPADAEAAYDAAIVRVPGGQWCWSPPLVAPDPGPPPCRAHGHVVFGSTARGFRLTPAVLEAWARLLARVPGSRLELLGRSSRDWSLRAAFEAVLRAHAVDPARVGYQYQRGYADHLAFFRSIDVALDGFPGNAGLGLLDALWMGVPVVGATVGASAPLGARQALSVLGALGHPEWCAESVDGYVACAAALAAEPDRLATLRAGLRPLMRTAPLTDARRVAATLETAWRAMADAARPIVEAADAKDRGKAVAQRALSRWLAHGERLHLPRAAQPSVSVVVVLFNQAGLTRQALQALADQRGVAFETLIVDNASTDDTAALLDRIDGAEILRNPDNRHFLGAVNQAAAQARGRYLLLLNNDAIVQEGALAVAAGRLDGDPTVGAVGGRIVLADGRLQEAGCIMFGDGSTLGYGRGDDPEAPAFRFVRDVDFCSGAFLMVRADLWRALGGFDARYGPAYYEDTDLCVRLRAAGHRVVYDPAIRVGHLEWGSATAPDQATEQMRRNQAVFRARHRALLAARPAPHAANLLIERWAACPRPRILVVDNGVPHVAVGGGMPRARLILQALDRHHVTLFPLWRFDDDWRDVAATVPEGTEVMLGYGARRFARFLEERTGVYHVMLVSRPPNLAWLDRLRRRRPRLFDGMRVVFDAEALFALRDIAEAAVRGAPLRQAEQRRRILEEVRLAATADRVIAVSRRDAEWYAAAGVRDVRVIGHGVMVRADAPGPERRRGLLFVGALDPATPNEDALVWFVERVLPRLPAALALTIVGEVRSNAVAALAGPRVRLLGRIEDLGPHYDAARLFVAPARFAAGVAAKVIEAAAHGLPVVASTVLARQLDWASGLELATAREAAEFAAAIRRLDRDDGLWRRLQQGALRRVAEQFDATRFADAVRAAVAF